MGKGKLITPLKTHSKGCVFRCSLSLTIIDSYLDVLVNHIISCDVCLVNLVLTTSDNLFYDNMNTI